MPAVSDASTRILATIRELCGYDRVMCSAGYDAAVDYLAAQARLFSEHVSVETVPARAEYWGWTIPESLNHWKDGRADPRMIVPADRDQRYLHVAVPGTELAEEILFVSHVCHPFPSANDNASGPAMMLELARHFTETPAAVGLRFLFGVEYWSPLAFCADHPELVALTVAGVSLDMVGGDQDLTGCSLIVDEIPPHHGSVMDLLLWNKLQAKTRKTRYRSVGSPVRSFRVDLQPYTGGSDHYILNDIEFAIPATCLNTFPDRFYHTTEDTIDKISEETLSVFFDTIVESVLDFRTIEPHKVALQASQIMARFEEQVADILGRRTRCDLDGLEPDLEERAYYIEVASLMARSRLSSLGSEAAGVTRTEWLGVLEGLQASAYERFRLIYGVRATRPEDHPEVRLVRSFRGPISRRRLQELAKAEDGAWLSSEYERDPLFYHKMDAGLNLLPKHSYGGAAWIIRYCYSGLNRGADVRRFVALLRQCNLLQVESA